MCVCVCAIPPSYAIHHHVVVNMGRNVKATITTPSLIEHCQIENYDFVNFVDIKYVPLIIYFD